ncbi:MAG: transporter substrate-binding domain-containing protein [Rhodospirillaceae bacterium]|nr:transporter substrate-binding domain-containing protein [Rhodospirillales bacterium]
MTTAKHTPELRVVDRSVVANRPGYQAELVSDAAKRCGAEVEYQIAPWQRALLLVKNGDADGAFSSSYDEERAAYAVYPMADGKPDFTRALKGYSYSLYVHRDGGPTWDGNVITAANRTVAVERGSSAIPRITELDLSPVENADNATMLRMVAGKRVGAAAIITSFADAILAEAPDLAATVVKREPPIESKFGYVMLSKPFYARHKGVAECFWTMIRDIRATPQYVELVRSYLAEGP